MEWFKSTDVLKLAFSSWTKHFLSFTFIPYVWTLLFVNITHGKAISRLLLYKRSSLSLSLSKGKGFLFVQHLLSQMLNSLKGSWVGIMKESLSELMLQYYPDISEFNELHSTFITNCVFNNFLCYTAIMLNIVTIHAVRKISSLPNTLKTLFLSLVVSDVGGCLLVQPFYTSPIFRRIQHKIAGWNSYKIFDILIGLFSVVSFLLVVAVSVDTFLAIHLHLRYQELVTHKRVLAVVISIWTLSAFLFLMMLWVPQDITSMAE